MMHVTFGLSGGPDQLKTIKIIFVIVLLHLAYFHFYWTNPTLPIHILIHTRVCIYGSN